MKRYALGCIFSMFVSVLQCESIKEPITDKTHCPMKILMVVYHFPQLPETFIKTIESVVGKKASIVIKDTQAGDVSATHADIKKAERLLGYHPKVSLREGLERMFAWYKDSIKSLKNNVLAYQ